MVGVKYSLLEALDPEGGGSRSLHRGEYGPQPYTP